MIPFSSFDSDIGFVFTSSCLVNLSVDHVEPCLNCLQFVSTDVHYLLVQPNSTRTNFTKLVIVRIMQ